MTERPLGRVFVPGRLRGLEYATYGLKPVRTCMLVGTTHRANRLGPSQTARGAFFIEWKNRSMTCPLSSALYSTIGNKFTYWADWPMRQEMGAVRPTAGLILPGKIADCNSPF